jgi:hypothetical protein
VSHQRRAGVMVLGMDTDRPPLANDPQADAPPRRLWRGMIAFASFVLLLVGGFHVIGGFVALLEDDGYAVASDDLLIPMSYNAWGIVHMALGVGMVLLGVALFYRQPWSRSAVVAVAFLSALNNLAFLPAAPAWFGLMILLDILVIYAVIVHFEDEPEDW